MSSDAKNTVTLDVINEKYALLTHDEKYSVTELKKITDLMDKKTAVKLHESASDMLKKAFALLEIDPESNVLRQNLCERKAILEALGDRITSFSNTEIKK